jgi:hypothetical protein
LSPTERFANREDEGDFRASSSRPAVAVDSAGGHSDDYQDPEDYGDAREYGEYDHDAGEYGDPAEYGEYGDAGEYEYYDPIDRRWIWVAGVAGAILLVAVICTVVILGGGDSGSVSTTVLPPVTTSQAPVTPSATTPAAPPPVTSLPPETVTTVTPTASAPSDTPPDPAAPAAPTVSPNAITYRVTGNRNLLDLVTVIYTDAQGALQTDVNVALPWSKTVVLDPGVTLSSVTATSVTAQLNCSITNATGTAIAVQNNNTMITNCTK